MSNKGSVRCVSHGSSICNKGVFNLYFITQRGSSLIIQNDLIGVQRLGLYIAFIYHEIENNQIYQLHVISYLPLGILTRCIVDISSKKRGSNIAVFRVCLYFIIRRAFKHTRDKYFLSASDTVQQDVLVVHNKLQYVYSVSQTKCTEHCFYSKTIFM